MKATTFELLRMGFVPVRWKGGNAGAALGMEVPNVAEAFWIGGDDWLVSPYPNSKGEYPPLSLEGLRETFPEPYGLREEVRDFAAGRLLQAPGGFFEVPGTRQDDGCRVTSLWMSRGGSLVEVRRLCGRWPLGHRVLRVENAGDTVESPLWGQGSEYRPLISLKNEYELRTAQLVFEGFRPEGRNPYTGKPVTLRETFPEGFWLSAEEDYDNYVVVFPVPDGGMLAVRDGRGGPRPEAQAGSMVRLEASGEVLVVTSTSLR